MFDLPALTNAQQSSSCAFQHITFVCLHLSMCACVSVWFGPLNINRGIHKCNTSWFGYSFSIGIFFCSISHQSVIYYLQAWLTKMEIIILFICPAQMSRQYHYFLGYVEQFLSYQVHFIMTEQIPWWLSWEMLTTKYS